MELHHFGVFARSFKTETTLTFLKEISDQLLQNVLMLVLLLTVLFEHGQRSMKIPLKYNTGALFHLQYDIKATF